MANMMTGVERQAVPPDSLHSVIMHALQNGFSVTISPQMRGHDGALISARKAGGEKHNSVEIDEWTLASKPDSLTQMIRRVTRE